MERTPVRINKYDLAALAALNDLDDTERHKLSAQRQRELFGFVICGKKDISFFPNNQGVVRIGRSVVGRDYVWRDYTYEAFADLINDCQAAEAW